MGWNPLPWRLCPNVGWYCCPDGMYCAATAADCPFVAKKADLVKMAAPKQWAGTAALMACTVLPPLLTAHMLSIISTGLLPKSRKISFISYSNNLLQKHKM